MTHRANLNSLSPASRQNLVTLMLQYITDPVVDNHMNIIHSGLDLFVGHRAYIAGMEAYLAANNGGQFAPLPLWDPATPIPPEFNVVKPDDAGNPRLPLQNLNPQLALPPEFRPGAVCSFASGADLGNAVNGWHGSVHIRIGGAMGDIMISPSAPIFWCWHAFLDHVYVDWQQCLIATPVPSGNGAAATTTPATTPAPPPRDDGDPRQNPNMYKDGTKWLAEYYPAIARYEGREETASHHAHSVAKRS